MNEALFLDKLARVWGTQMRPVGTYSGAHTKLPVVCTAHNVEFSPLPTNLLSGHGCPGCRRDRTRTNRKGAKQVLTQDQFVARAKAVHGDKYDYTNAQYINAKNKMVIGCRPCGGVFSQNYSNHVLSKKGCPQCKALAHMLVAASLGRIGGQIVGDRTRLSFDECVARARAVHGGKYEYLRTESVNGVNCLVAVCFTHGEFRQAYWDHTNPNAPQGCPHCSVQHSFGEQQLRRFIERVTGAPAAPDRKLLGGRLELDLYMPNHGLALEYCGEYWHSNANAASKNNTHRHKHKHDLCAKQGIRLLTLWESEWKTRPHAVKQLIRTAVGKQRATVYARKCTVEMIDNAAAREFFDKYHVQGGAGSGKYNYGLMYGKHLVAVMRFSFGNNDRGIGAKTRTWTLARYATRCSVPGGASRLFKAFLRERNPSHVKSFSDERLFAGGMYSKLGFIAEETNAPDYQVWSPKLGLRPKSHYQRRAIPDRLKDHGFNPTEFDPVTDPRTEQQMLKHMKCGQLYDCGKTRWVWTAPIS